MTQNNQFEIVIESVNDPPIIITTPNELETNEDMSKEIIIEIQDVDFDDEWGSLFTVSLQVSFGTLSLNDPMGLYVSTQQWETSGNIVFQGSKINSNNALNPVTYTPSLNFIGNDTLKISVSDQGNTGQYGGVQWTNITIPIIVNETNGDDLLPMINGFDDVIECYEDIQCYMNNVTITIPNLAKIHQSNFTVQIAVTHDMGYVSINPNGIDSVKLLIGNGTMDTVVQFMGNYSNVNKAFYNFSFLSTLNNFGVEGYIKINVTNNFGQTSENIKDLYLYEVNDAPMINVPYNTINIDEDNALQIVGITIEDVDVNYTIDANFYCNISCLYGKIGLMSLEGIQFESNTTDKTSTLIMYATAGLMQIAISVLQYIPDDHYNGIDIITINVHDNGNTGIGGILSDSKAINITINAVSDPPFITCPYLSAFGEEDKALLIEGTSLIDTDNRQNPLYIRFTLNHGIINTTSYSVETIYSVDESVDSYSWQGLINASYTEISDIVANISYYPVLNYNQVCCGHEILVIAASYNSSFTDLVSECEIDIYISSVNDAPTIIVDTSQNVEEDEILSLGIQVNDVDILETAGGKFFVSLFAPNGTINCDFWPGSWVRNGAVDTNFIEIVGRTPQVMDTIRTCKFTPDMDFCGNRSVVITAWDNGLSGNIGSNETVIKHILINVTSVSDAPRIFMNDPNYTSSYQLYTDEDTNFTMEFIVWEVDETPFNPYLNDSIFTFSSLYGTIYAKDFDATRWSTIEQNGELIAKCINCSFTHDTISIQYKPNLNVNIKNSGTEKIHVHTEDIDGAESDLYYYMTINPINDAVIITCLTDRNIAYEDIPIDFNWTVDDPDVDEDNGFLLISIQSKNGTFYFEHPETPSFIQQQGSICGNNSVLMGQGALQGVQTMLKDLRFMSTPNYFGNASITISINDQANYGNDNMSYWSNCTQNIVIYPVNDALNFSDSLDYIIHIAEDATSFISGMTLYDQDSTNDYVYTILVSFDKQIANISFPFHPNQEVSISGNKTYILHNLSYVEAQSLVNNISIIPATNFNGYIEMFVEITSNDTSQPNKQYAISKDHIIHLLAVERVNDGPSISMTLSLTINEDECGYIQINVTDIDYHEALDGYFTGILIAENVTFDISDYYGLNYIDGVPQNSSSWSFTCASLELLNRALSQIEVCSSTPHFYGHGSIYFNISDNGYSHGDESVNGVSSASLSDSETITITILPVVDFVVVEMEDQYEGFEDTLSPLIINISTYDIIKPDLSISLSSAKGNVTTTLNNSISFNSTSSFHALQMIGDWTSCQQALKHLMYDPDPDWNGWDDYLLISVNITLTGQITTEQTTVHISAVNDPIFISSAKYSNYSLWEDESVKIDGITLSDIDVMDDQRQMITATINTTNGVLSLDTFQGLQYLQGSGNRDQIMKIRGAFQHVNNALGIIRFYPNENWFGETNITIIVSDEGWTGIGSNYTDSLIIPLTIISTPDTPIFELGTDTMCDEDGFGYFVGGSVYDIDSDLFQIKIWVENGVLTLNSRIGLSFQIGNGTNDASMIFNGSAININNAISNITYYPNNNWNGHDTLFITCTDFDTALITHEHDIEVIAVNDAPDVIVEINLFETLDSIPVAIRGLSVSDLDFYESDYDLCELNIFAKNGTVNLGAIESVNILNNSGEIKLKSDLDNMNYALTHLMYVSPPDFEGNDFITITFSDYGNTGNGGILTDSEIINVTINGVNHAPKLTKSTEMITMIEDGLSNFSLTVYDQDCVGIDCNLTLIIKSHKGFIKSLQCPELTMNSWKQQIIINGNATYINNCTTDITLKMLENWNGILGHEIEISLNDNGWYGEGDPFYVTDVIAVNVTNINDELNMLYTRDLLTLYSVKRGYSVPLIGLQLEDIDLNETNTELLMVNISVNHNKIGLYALNGLHFIDFSFQDRFKRTNRYSVLNFEGTMYSINKALPYLYFHSTNSSHCGQDIVKIKVSYKHEIVNTSLNINVTCS